MKTASGRNIDNGGNRIVPYAAYNIKMNSIVFLGFMLSLFSLVSTETFFPGKLIKCVFFNVKLCFMFYHKFKGNRIFMSFHYHQLVKYFIKTFPYLGALQCF